MCEGGGEGEREKKGGRETGREGERDELFCVKTPHSDKFHPKWERHTLWSLQVWSAIESSVPSQICL